MTAPRSLLLLGALALVQLAVPAWQTARYESTLRTGHLFRIKVEPIDPADAFRGRYVRLNLLLPSLAPIEPRPQDWNRKGWVVLEDGPDGFAQVKTFSWTRLQDRNAAPARLEQRWSNWRVALLLDRYYMNEDRAPEVEREIGRATRVPERPHETIVRVRVKDGIAAIEGLDLDGTAR